MIYTISLNPAVDYYMYVDDFIEGGLNIAKSSYTKIGGKGINVSTALSGFGIESLALGFIGGFTGQYILDEIKKINIKEKFVLLNDKTRINLKLKNGNIETEIAGDSPNITNEDYKKFMESLKNVKSGDVLVLSGSVPSSLKENTYEEIIDIIPKGSKIILDTRGNGFKKAVKKGVYLTKPNVKELEEFFDVELKTIDEIVKYGKKLLELGSENTLISMGKEGSILITKDSVLIGNAPKGKLISSVGAGDSMVAGIIYGLSKNLSLEESFKYGIASGSSTAFSEGLTDLKGMENLLDNVKIKLY